MYTYIHIYFVCNHTSSHNNSMITHNNRQDVLHPISLLTLSVLRLLDSIHSGNAPMDMIIPTLKFYIMLESNPLTSRILIRKLAVGWLSRPFRPFAVSPLRLIAWGTYTYIYIYIYIYICMAYVCLFISYIEVLFPAFRFCRFSQPLSGARPLATPGP